MAFSVFFALIAPACGPGPPRVTSAVAELPEYTAIEAALFGNLLGPTVFGLRPDSPPKDDPKLGARALRADFVLPVRVSTVTKESLASAEEFALSLVPTGPPVMGRAPDGAVELRVGPGSPSHMRVEARAASLVGRTFLLFARRYSLGGQPVLRWHGEADGPAIREAIQRAKALDASRKPAQTGR